MIFAGDVLARENDADGLRQRGSVRFDVSKRNGARRLDDESLRFVNFPERRANLFFPNKSDRNLLLRNDLLNRRVRIFQEQPGGVPFECCNPRLGRLPFRPLDGRLGSSRGRLLAFRLRPDGGPLFISRTQRRILC